MSNAPQLWFSSSYRYIYIVPFLALERFSFLASSGKGYAENVHLVFLVPDIKADTTLPRQFFWAWRVCHDFSTALRSLTPNVGSDPETIDTGTIPSRYAAITANKQLLLGGKHNVQFDMDKDMLWRWDQVLKTHPNGMRFSCFGIDGDLLATNEYFSVGGGFVVNEKTKGR